MKCNYGPGYDEDAEDAEVAEVARPDRDDMGFRRPRPGETCADCGRRPASVGYLCRPCLRKRHGLPTGPVHRAGRRK